MIKEDVNREIRRQRAIQRLGRNNPRCVRCGEDDPLCLELHHIAGQAFDDTTVIQCRNCHRKLSDMQRDHPDQIGNQPTIQERAGHLLLGIADLFEILIDVLKRFGNALLEIARSEETKGAR